MYQEFMFLLLEVKDTLTLIRPFPRCKVPVGTYITDFIVQGDASMHLVAFTTHIQVKNGDEMQSNLLTSGSWIRRGSIPSLELLAFSIALEKNNTLLHNHQSTLFTEKKCNIYFILDSTCALYSLCPSKISKSILQRNVKSQTMNVLTQLSTSYPNLEIYLCHVPTSMMIADLATKRQPAIVEALNSNEWRYASSTNFFSSPQIFS